MMKIIFIGLGSIGQRHLKNIVQILNRKKQCYRIDAMRSMKKYLPAEVETLLCKQYENADLLDSDYDIAFITNPTSMHYDTLRMIGRKAKNIFVEKPVFDSCEYNISKIMLREKAVCYVACPLRYKKVIQYLKTFIKNRKVYSMRVICSSYLPDWRPGTDYRATYSAKKEMGGGVNIDLIHEWDYICYLFGVPERIDCFKGKYSDLDITSDDVAVYIAQYNDKVLSVHLDYFGKYPRREIEIYIKDDVVVADLINNQVKFLRAGNVIEFDEMRDDFQIAELEYFIGLTEGIGENQNSLKNAVDILRIAKAGVGK